MTSGKEALPSLREVMQRHDIRPKKALGQNFLLDPQLLAKIARQAGELANRTVIEIGPGPGGLTRALLDAGAAKIIAVEKDQRAIAALTELAAAYPGRLEIIEADALKLDVASLGDAPRKLVANLPYNIGTPLLFQWLEQIEKFERLTLMFQKEVADRIAAEPGNKDYGKLTIMAQVISQVTRHFDIPPHAFVPPPKVTSTLLSVIPRNPPMLVPELRGTLNAICSAAFNQRRKMIKSSLKNVVSEQSLQKAGIDPTIRAEQLDIKTFCRLAEIHAQAVGHTP